MPCDRGCCGRTCPQHGIGEFEGFHLRHGPAGRSSPPDWIFRSLIIERTDGARLELRCDADRWTMNGQPAAAIRRLHRYRYLGDALHQHAAHPPGEVRDRRCRTCFDMAWVPLDSLEPFVDWPDLHQARRHPFPLRSRRWQLHRQC